jgi:hypothetical protein
MMTFASEDTYMEMNPDTFAMALEQAEESPEVEQAYVAEQRSNLQQAVATEERIYAMLQQYDLPVTATNLAAMSSYLKDRNRIFEVLAEIKNDIFEQFGEAVKTPEEMAEAQRKLEETAENVMRTAIIEDAKGYIDVRGMKMVMTQLHTLGTMATREETYAIPITVADATGNMTLKIVRGKEEEKGLVDVALDMDATGCIRGSFRMSADTIEGVIATDRQTTRQTLAEHASELMEAIAKQTGTEARLSFDWNETVEANSIYEATTTDYETTTEKSEVQTGKLYGLARCFIDVLGKLSQ